MDNHDTSAENNTNAETKHGSTVEAKTIIKPRTPETPVETIPPRPEPFPTEKTRIQPRVRAPHDPLNESAQQPPVTALDDGTIIRPRYRLAPSRPAPKVKPKRLVYRNASIRAPDTPDAFAQLADDTPPLLALAYPILSLAPELRQCTKETDLDELRRELTAKFREFQSQLRATIESVTVREQTSYVLCALIDELIITSHWGERSDWAQRPLLSQFHGETYGGEHVFHLLDNALLAPRAHAELLEIIYIALSLGFRGELRLKHNGETIVQQRRQEIYVLLPEARRHPAPLLTAPSNEPATRAGAQHHFAPLWIFVGVVALAAFGAYTYLRTTSIEKTDHMMKILATTVEPVKEATLAIGKVRPKVTRLKRQLAEEILQGVVNVTDYTTHTEIALVNASLFPAGRTTIAESAHPVLYKIAKVLEGLPGKIVVSGHTDDQDIKTIQYPSNWHLSLARAAAVVSYLETQAELSGRIVPEGRGAEQPLTRANTAEARARNRRVVIEWYYGGDV